MLRKVIPVLASLLLSVSAIADTPTEPSIEIAICLDTSGSMDGLIDSAKQKLWAVVSDLGRAKPSPKLKVALYQYGNDGLDPKTGWVQQLSPLTDDLDSVYGRLFALRTNGGTEYVARVIQSAATDLQWSADSSTLRMVVVAGNEPATQDQEVKLPEACKLAAGKGIVVNTVFCGAEQEGRSTGWAEAARLADGQFSAIDQNGGTVVIATPFDQEIASLGEKLNSTYVAYGAGGAAGAQSQLAQDRNAAALSPSAAAVRSAGKAQSQYSNAHWDLVDAVKQKRVKVEEVAEAQLPEPMKKMDAKERTAFVETKANERQQLQQQINDLNTKREQYLKDEMARQGLSDKNSFDAALRKSVREQAGRKGIQFEEAAK